MFCATASDAIRPLARVSRSRCQPHRKCESRLQRLVSLLNHNSATAANGSHELSSYHVYSARLAICKLVSLPHSLAITANAMSIPALTPEDVKYLPSSTHRAFAIHSTFGA